MKTDSKNEGGDVGLDYLYNINYNVLYNPLLPFSDFASFLALLAPINTSVDNNKRPEYLILVLLEMIEQVYHRLID